MRTTLIAAAIFAATATAAAAQSYPYAPVYPYTPAQAAPPAWSYDPYTSGMAPCPQGMHDLQTCAEKMPPTYGQPSYWPVGR